MTDQDTGTAQEPEQCRCALGAHEKYRCSHPADDVDQLCEICRWYRKELDECE